MIDRDLYLLHEVHSAKLAADALSGLASTALMWRHQVGAALLAGLVPSTLASAVVVRTDLSRLRTTRRGRYVLTHMPPAAQIVRLSGQGIMWLAAHRRRRAGVAAGVVVVLIGWSQGLLPAKR